MHVYWLTLEPIYLVIHLLINIHMFLTVHMSTYVFYTSSPDNQQHILLSRCHLYGGTGLCRHILRMFCCSHYHTILSHKLEHNNYNCIQCTTVFLFFWFLFWAVNIKQSWILNCFVFVWLFKLKTITILVYHIPKLKIILESPAKLLINII